MENRKIPLADKMRPDDFDNFFGQEDLITKNKFLLKAIESDNLPSLIFWGPPGSGKTTLALILAKKIKSDFIRFSAVVEGVKDLRKVIDKAQNNKIFEKRTILFVDEIHRWNKAQQDALLPHIENGNIILIGATTENPSFEIRNALLSRCRVLLLKELNEPALVDIIKTALKDEERGLGKEDLKINQESIEFLASISNGDARTALNILEAASFINKEITKDVVIEASQKKSLFYDKDGENHYNIISALHKSMRGSDPDAALYWLARMLEAGEDPLYVARRLVRFASEDIGLANSQALNQAIAVYNACRFIGMPECKINLAQAVVYMSKCKKSNDLYVAYNKAALDVQEKGNLLVPLHLRNASTNLMKEFGYGKDYKYSPDFEYQEDQDYFPPELKNKKYFK
jgi:putative ATPase